MFFNGVQLIVHTNKQDALFYGFFFFDAITQLSALEVVPLVDLAKVPLTIRLDPDFPVPACNIDIKCQILSTYNQMTTEIRTHYFSKCTLNFR